MLKKLNIGKNTDPYDALSSVKSLVGTLGLEEMLFGIDVTKYIKVSKPAKIGSLDLGAIFDEELFGQLTLGILNDSYGTASTYAYQKGRTDSSPADNNMKINTKTMAYSTLQ